MSSIRLHPEHALNPTVTVCYFCGKEKNEVAFLGAAYKGKAPSKCCIDQVPCDECAKMLKKGVVLISVADGETGPDPYRTGHISVIKKETAKRIFESDSKVFFVEESMWEMMQLPPYDKPETKI